MLRSVTGSSASRPGERQDRSAQRRMADTDRSTSSSVVFHPETLIRITSRFFHRLPPSQQVPSAWTRAMTSRVNASVSLAAGRIESHQHLVEHHLVEHVHARHAPQLLREAPGTRAAAVDQVATPRRPIARSAA